MKPNEKTVIKIAAMVQENWTNEYQDRYVKEKLFLQPFFIDNLQKKSKTPCKPLQTFAVYIKCRILFKYFELKVIIEKSTTVTALLKRLVPGQGQATGMDGTLRHWSLKI